jgi:hypothetical protein
MLKEDFSNIHEVELSWNAAAEFRSLSVEL